MSRPAFNCEACGQPLLLLDENRCTCGRVVCVRCSFAGDHWIGGAHRMPAFPDQRSRNAHTGPPQPPRPLPPHSQP